MSKSKMKEHLDSKKVKKTDKEKEVEMLYELDHVDDEDFQASEAKREVKEEKKEQEEVKDVVDLVRSSYYEYFERLADYGNYLLSKVELPKGFRVMCMYTTPNHKARLFNGEDISAPEGVLFVLHNGKSNFIKGMKVTRNAEYDINAVEILATELENTVDFLTGALEGSKPKKPSGLIL